MIQSLKALVNAPIQPVWGMQRSKINEMHFEVRYIVKQDHSNKKMLILLNIRKNRQEKNLGVVALIPIMTQCQWLEQ